MVDHNKLDNTLNGTFKIKKHSSLIQIRSQMTLIQRKALNGLIYLIKRELSLNPEKTIFRIELGVLKTLCGIKRTDNSSLKKALLDMAKLHVEYNVLGKDKETWGVFSFLSHIQIQVQKRGFNSIILVECPSIIIEAIRKPRLYSQFNLEVIRKFKSKHSLVLYELLFDYVGLKRIHIDLVKLKRIFGFDENMYGNGYSMFQKRVLQPSIHEVNQCSDLFVDIESIERIGRKVLGITFAMKRVYKYIERSSDYDLVGSMKSIGIPDSLIESILDEFDIGHIKTNIAYIKHQISKGITIKSISGYTLSCLRNNFGMHRDSASDGTLSIESALFYSKTKFDSYLNDLLDSRMNGSNQSEQEELYDQFISGLGEMNVVKKMAEKKGQDHPIVASLFKKYLLQHFLTPEELDFERFKPIPPLTH